MAEVKLRVSPLAVALLVAGLPAGSGRLSVVPGVGEQTTYQFTSTAKTGQGTLATDGAITLVRRNASDLRIEIATNQGSTTNVDATAARDGTIGLPTSADLLPHDPAATPEPQTAPIAVQRLNQIAQAIANAPRSPQVGDGWRGSVSVPLPRGGAASVPVQVRIATASDTDVTLEADGSAKTSLDPQPGSQDDAAPGMNGVIPVELRVHTKAHFHVGALVDGSGTLHATIEGRRTIDVDSDWTLTQAPQHA